jgi:HSP20 family molecular chaperone IbpA
MSVNELSDVRHDLDRCACEAAPSRRTFVPRADIRETPDAVVITADMPGVDAKSVDVRVERDLLTIHGTVAPEKPEGYTPAYTEYATGDWHREFVLSDEVKRDAIRAAVKNGVLRLTLPKADPARKIEVKADS